MTNQTLQIKDSESIERRIKYLELSIITITAILAIYSLTNSDTLLISVIFLLAVMIESLFSFVFDSFLEKKEIIEKDDFTSITSKLFNVWEWVYFTMYFIVVLSISIIFE